MGIKYLELMIFGGLHYFVIVEGYTTTVTQKKPRLLLGLFFNKKIMRKILAVLITAFCLSCTPSIDPAKPETQQDKVEIVRELIQSKCPYIDWGNAIYEVDTTVYKPDPKYWNVAHLKTIVPIRSADWNYDPWIPFTGSPSYRGAGTWDTVVPTTNSGVVINFTYYSNGQQWREVAEVWELKHGVRYLDAGWRVTFSKPLKSY